MNKMYVTRLQLMEIKTITDHWTGERFMPALAEYLRDEEINTETDPDELFPEYNFIAGGIDHIDDTRDSITIHDRCLQTSGGETLDGTTKFVVRRVKKMTSYDYGKNYREYLETQCNYTGGHVNIDAEIIDGIPEEDYLDMLRSGIKSPDARNYWRGFNRTEEIQGEK